MLNTYSEKMPTLVLGAVYILPGGGGGGDLAIYQVWFFRWDNKVDIDLP